MPPILLTGSSGFLGSRILTRPSATAEYLPISLQTTEVSSIDFLGITAVLHCAGIAHRMEKTEDQLYFSINRDLTLELARAAKEAGVKHFVFLSTIKVFGVDASNLPLTIDTACYPNDAYGQSKWEAEEGLRTLEDDNFKVAVVRPPLIYGPGAKGNLERIMQLIAKSKMPLPFARINNRRSMVYADNLVAYLEFIMERELSGTFLPADEPPISTSQLVKLLVQHINPEKKVVSLPSPLRAMMKWLKPEFHQRLFGSLEVESTYKATGFTPPFTIEEGLKAMAEAFSTVRY
jgi:nucleoside-diphosphate-sugar epimerase